MRLDKKSSQSTGRRNIVSPREKLQEFMREQETNRLSTDIKLFEGADIYRIVTNIREQKQSPNSL